jgi:hypothetical protein
MPIDDQPQPTAIWLTLSARSSFNCASHLRGLSIRSPKFQPKYSPYLSKSQPSSVSRAGLDARRVDHRWNRQRSPSEQPEVDRSVTRHHSPKCAEATIVRAQFCHWIRSAYSRPLVNRRSERTALLGADSLIRRPCRPRSVPANSVDLAAITGTLTRVNIDRPFAPDFPWRFLQARPV